MDPTVLLQCFGGTLEADPNIRRQSEQQLQQLSLTAGFLKGCLDIHEYGSQTHDIPASYKVASAVYLKNKITKCWGIADTNDANLITVEEKQYIKSKLLKVMTQSEYHIKQQLISVLKLIITLEYPHNWPELLEMTGEYFQTAGASGTGANGNKTNENDTSTRVLTNDDFNKLYTGLVSLVEIVRKFRWLKNKERASALDPIIEQSFPLLLEIGNLMVDNSEELTEFNCEILKLILKIYKFATYYDLPDPLQTQDSIIAWSQLHGNIINMNLPSYVTKLGSGNERDKDLLQVSKALKWSLANINRLISRYVNSSRYKSKPFQVIYTNEFLPYLIKNLIKLVELWCDGKRWLNLSSLYYLIEILSVAVSIKSLWAILKPIVGNLIELFIYPIIRLTPEKIETFDNDPHEYIQLTFNIFLTTNNSPDVAAVRFLNSLLDHRMKHCFDVVVTFLYQELSTLVQLQAERPGDTLEEAIKKESLLRIIGSITNILLANNSKNQYFHQMEQFLMKLIVPNFSSNFKFLEARTFDIIGKFSDLTFQDPDNLNMVMYHVLKNFRDNSEDNLVINLENALAIQSYLHLPEFKDHLSVIILPVMSRLLEISKEIDNDTISVVMQECVENFSEQLQPFGVELIYNLVENFMRIVSEMDEPSNNEDVGFTFTGAGEDNNDKIIAAIGILNTIITVLLSFENNKAIVQELTGILIPLIKCVLVTKNDNYLSEIGEIVENLVYLNKSVTKELFEVLQLINSLIDDGIGIMYFEELLPSLKNYLIYSGEKEPDFEHARNLIYLNIFSKVNTAYDNYNDLILNFELIQYFILALRTKSMRYLPDITSQTLLLLDVYEESANNLLFKISFNNVIISAIIYDSNLVIMMLQEKFNTFLTNWFKIIPKLTRVYDIKLSVLGLMSLINNSNIIMNPNLSSNLLLLLNKLPNAIRELTKRKSLFNADFHSSLGLGEEDFEDPFGDTDESENGSEEEQPVPPNPDEDQDDYLNFLQQEDLKLDDDIVEDPLEVTPLDNINLPQILHNFMSLLQSHNGDKFEKLFGDIPVSDLTELLNKFT